MSRFERIAAITASLFVGISTTLAVAQSRTPNAFEAFAKQQDVRSVWTQPVGDLESEASRAVMTAVVLADSSGATRRGLRIDLRHRDPNVTCPPLTHGRSLCADPNAAIWLEEDDLDRVHAGVVRGNFDNLIGRYRGSEPRPGHGVKIAGFTFKDRTPDELISLLDRGRTTLANAPVR